MELKVIGFDLYNTILQIETEYEDIITYYSFSQFMKNDYNIEIDAEKFKKEYLNEYYRTIECLEKNREYNVYDIFTKLLPMVDNKDILKEIIYKFRVASRLLLRVDKNLSDILTYLKQKYILLLLTNAQQYYTLNEIKMFGLQKYFDNIIISSEVGLKKPAKEIFDIALRKYDNIMPNNALYIGDNYETDVSGAINAGWNAIWFANDLSKYNVNNEERKKIFKIISDLKDLKYIL